MSADQSIHVMTEILSLEDLQIFYSNVLGHKWWNPFLWEKKGNLDAMSKIIDTPRVWIGEVSWLKAGVTGNPKAYIPATIERISQVIDDGVTVCTSEVIEKIQHAFEQPNETDYSLNDVREVIEFLKQHQGQVLFTVGW